MEHLSQIPTKIVLKMEKYRPISNTKSKITNDALIKNNTHYINETYSMSAKMISFLRNLLL